MLRTYARPPRQAGAQEEVTGHVTRTGRPQGGCHHKEDLRKRRSRDRSKRITGITVITVIQHQRDHPEHGDPNDPREDQ
jgi:hypothetical protein